MEDYERNILKHIDEYGCSVTSVFDPDEKEPPFTYSIGIAKSSGAPELIIVGLGSKLSLWMVNEYNRRCRAGERFQPGVLYLGFLEGFAVQFGAVTREHRQGLRGHPPFSRNLERKIGTPTIEERSGGKIGTPTIATSAPTSRSSLQKS